MTEFRVEQSTLVVYGGGTYEDIRFSAYVEDLIRDR